MNIDWSRLITKEQKAEAARVAAVPQKVPMQKGERIMILHGIFADIQGVLDAIPGMEGELARAKFRRSQFVERSDPLVEFVRQQRGWTHAQIDKLFIDAEALE